MRQEDPGSELAVELEGWQVAASEALDTFEELRDDSTP